MTEGRGRLMGHQGQTCKEVEADRARLRDLLERFAAMYRDGNPVETYQDGALRDAVFAELSTANPERCGRCAGAYWRTVWRSDDALWERVVAGRFGLLCPSCFSTLAEEAGIMLTWRPDLRRENSDHA